MSLVELYMKELVMQQKLQHEYLLQQQQLFNQQNFQPPPSGGQLDGTFQLFQPLQMMPPPASFPPLQFVATTNNTPGTAGPFAAAPYCAAKPMETTFDSFAGTTGFPTFTQMANQMFSNNSIPTFSNYNNSNNNINTYPFAADSTQSPSCCGSSLASLDSFPSPASSDSPDSNSCSSLSAPTVIHHKQQQQKRHSLQYKFPIINNKNNAIVSNGIGAAKKQQPMPPTDFSELMGTAAGQKPLLINNGQQLNQRAPQFVNKNNAAVAVGGVQKRPAPTAAEPPQCAASAFRKVRRTTVFVPIGSAKSFLPAASSTASSAPKLCSTETTTTSSDSSTSTLVAVSSSSTMTKVASNKAPNLTSMLGCATATSSSCTPRTIGCSTSSSSKASTSSSIPLTDDTVKMPATSSSSTTTTSEIVSLLLAPPKAQLENVRPTADKKPNLSSNLAPAMKASAELDQRNSLGPKLPPKIVPSSVVDQTVPKASTESYDADMKRESLVCTEESATEKVDQHQQQLDAEKSVNEGGLDSGGVVCSSVAVESADRRPVRSVMARSPLKVRKRKKADENDGTELAEEVLEPDALTLDMASPRATNGGPIPCRWMRCMKRFANDNELYDHLAADHVEQLGKLALAEQREHEQLNAAGGSVVRRRRSNDANGRDAVLAERFRCRWRKCEMHARRGDAQKKLDWLLTHLFIRHAPKAQPHKCLFADCSLRFQKLQALKDHLRSAHDDITPKANGRRSCGDATKVTWFELRPCIHMQNVHDCLDSRTVEWIRRRLHVTLGGLLCAGDTAEAGTDFFVDDAADEPSSCTASSSVLPPEQKQKIGRMSLNETIVHLRNAFLPRRRQLPAAISLPVA
uniref:C2H2-type domain-containing protein n=1 Tax=Globodera rostochiensis TaxID=31243 RepID=A0A914I5S4_GLORO